MYKQIVFIFLVVFSMSEVFSQSCMSLVWSDEFDINGTPDSKVWGYDLGNSGYGNNEVQNYTNLPENVRVENGMLIIEAKKSSGNWTSARLKSIGKKSFTYGRIEFRAKLPAGSGTWPALWMLGENITSTPWPACGEIDIMEHVGKNPGQVHASLHSTSSYGATQNTGITQVPDFSGAFHIYALDWTENKMDFYVDDKLYYTYAPATKNDNTWPFNKPFFIIMNVAMGGNWGSDPQYESGGLKNGIDPSLTSVRMEVDYVRYYSITEKPKILGNGLVDEGETTSYFVPATPGAQYQWVVPDGAQITAGQNSNTINVTWGNTSGDVSVNILVGCGEVVPNSLLVQVRSVPTSPVFSILNTNSNNALAWEVIPTNGNIINLSLVPELEVAYSIMAPANNPQLRYDMGGVFNLSAFSYLALELKTDNAVPPSVVRLDLIDYNGNNNQDNLFKISNFINDGQYHIYAAPIVSSQNFNMAAVKEMRLYINYGIFGVSGTSKIWLKEVSLLKENPLSVTDLKVTDFIVFPNPATDFIAFYSPAPIVKIEIYNTSGQLVFNTTSYFSSIDVQLLPSGIYTVNAIDKLKQKHIARFVKH